MSDELINRDRLEQDVIIRKIIAALDDIKKEIDLNYVRIHFRNPAIRVILTMISEVIGSWLKMLDFPDKDDYVKPKTKFVFGNKK